MKGAKIEGSRKLKEIRYMIKRLSEFVKSETATPTLIAQNDYL